jgi:nucleotide-binding universal stress UspA family protein
MYKRLLVPLDGSPLAEAALSHAEGIAHQFGSEIVLLRVVVSPYAIVAPDLVLAGTDSNHQQFADQAEAYLKGMIGKLMARNIKARSITCEGPVAEAILDRAKEDRIDMIVMSTHGRGGVSRWVYGSVADRILQAAPCPVLLIRVTGGA